MNWTPDAKALTGVYMSEISECQYAESRCAAGCLDDQIAASTHACGDRGQVMIRRAIQAIAPGGGIVGQLRIECDGDLVVGCGLERELVERNRQALTARLDVGLLERPVGEEPQRLVGGRGRSQ